MNVLWAYILSIKKIFACLEISWVFRLMDPNYWNLGANSGYEVNSDPQPVLVNPDLDPQHCQTLLLLQIFFYKSQAKGSPCGLVMVVAGIWGQWFWSRAIHRLEFRRDCPFCNVYKKTFYFFFIQFVSIKVLPVLLQDPLYRYCIGYCKIINFKFFSYA